MNIMITTGAALMLLAVFVVTIGHQAVYVRTFFEIFGVNIIIHLGFVFINKIECAYVILESLIDVSYIVSVLVVSGLIFNWYSTMPVWYLVIMAVLIYVLGVFINIVRMKKDEDELNKLLQKHKNKNVNAVT